MDSECTFPPREWDPVEGRLVTVKQPNKRKSAPSTTSPSNHSTTPKQCVAPDLPIKILPIGSSLDSSNLAGVPVFSQPSSSFVPSLPPIDPTLVNGTHDANDLFSLFTDQLGLDANPWPFPDLSQSGSTDPFLGPNVLFDLGLTISTPLSPVPFGKVDYHEPPEASLNRDMQ